MYFCVADKTFLSSTTISALALRTYLSRHSLLPSILLYESSGVLSPGVGAFGMIRKPESYHIVSRYQVATPSRTITARATGPKVINDSLMRTTSRTPERFSGADHCKRLRVQTMRIIYTMYSDFDHSNSLLTAICHINSRPKVPRNGF